MGFFKKLFGWFFTYPAYRDIDARQSEAVVGLLTLALYADGEPEESEREELERELTGVPHYWAAEPVLRGIVRERAEGFTEGALTTEAFEALAAELAAPLGDVPRAFLLTGAAFVCHGDDELTELEKKNLTAMGRALGLTAETVEEIVSDPTKHSQKMFTCE